MGCRNLRGIPFIGRLNELLAEADFDRWIEGRCERYYATEEKRGQPSIPPGVYFRMLLVGYFEGIDSQRGIAWRCADSLSLRLFLGVPLDESTPDHSTLTNTRNRLPQEVFDEVFQFVLTNRRGQEAAGGQDGGRRQHDAGSQRGHEEHRATRHGRGLEAVRHPADARRRHDRSRPEPTDEEVRRYDKKRKNKRVSNEEWVSNSDAESRITQMKDGRTHLAYKAEHVVDLKSDIVLAAEIRKADEADTDTLVDSVMEAQNNLKQAGSHSRDRGGGGRQGISRGAHAGTVRGRGIEDLHSRAASQGIDRVGPTSRPEYQHAVYANRRRIKRAKSKRWQRLRSELCERTFAHVCDSGGMRRSWLRGVAKVTKRYLIAAAAHNLGRILRKLFGVGKPKALQGEGGLAAIVHLIAGVLVAWPARSCRRDAPGAAQLGLVAA